LLRRQHRRQQRRVRGIEEPIGSAEDERHNRELPDLYRARDRERSCSRDRDCFRRFHDHEDALLGNAIGRNAAEQHREQHPDGAPGRHYRYVDR
jgi:hypothetical protein